MCTLSNCLFQSFSLECCPCEFIALLNWKKKDYGCNAIYTTRNDNIFFLMSAISKYVVIVIIRYTSFQSHGSLDQPSAQEWTKCLGQQSTGAGISFCKVVIKAMGAIATVAIAQRDGPSISCLGVGPSKWESVTYASHLFNCEAYGKCVRLLGGEIFSGYDISLQFRMIKTRGSPRTVMCRQSLAPKITRPGYDGYLSNAHCTPISWWTRPALFRAQK